MKQKIMTLFITLLTCIVARSHNFEVDGIYYVITSSTDLTVSVSYRGSLSNDYSNEYSGAVVIPESVTYNGKTYSVTTIGSYAFYGCTGLTSVVIPSSVTTIGSYAFKNCNELYNEYDNGLYLENTENPYFILVEAKSKNITDCKINDRTRLIHDEAFLDCKNLKSIEIPNSVTTIGNGVFKNCSSLACVALPNSLTSIPVNTFSYCKSLTNIEIPNSVLKIGGDAFDCSGLTSIIIPNSVEEIGGETFMAALALKHLFVISRLLSLFHHMCLDL